jgi:hypothetical protein
LPLVLVDDNACWGQFLKHYISVVSDCPFVWERQSIKKAASPPIPPPAIRNLCLRSRRWRQNPAWGWSDEKIPERAWACDRYFGHTYLQCEIEPGFVSSDPSHLMPAAR